VALLLLAACGGGEDKGFEKGMASYFDKPTVDQQKAEAEQKMKALKEKAAKEADDAQKAEWDALLTPAPDAPKELKPACAGMADAYDAFMQKRLQGDALGRWNAIKGDDLGKAEKACVEAGSVEAANCKAHAFAGMPTGFDETVAPQILEDCSKKFAAAAPAK
jgi:hypothetical protein